ncbi:hypothetical protein Tco_1066767 [Tanacetum coccineum]|uniref:Uncharacterized protein n=1 Tax=Tanacetum coccineum TaxID=301880 RepID=A0ABQ5HCP7_9ASTR
MKELKEADFGSAILDSIQSQVPLIVNKYLGTTLPDQFRKVLRANNVKLKRELSELDYRKVIDEPIKIHVVNEVQNFLPQFLPKAVSDFV